MDPKDMIWATLAEGTAGNVNGFNFLPATPSKIGKAMTFGIQTKFSNLLKVVFYLFFKYGRERRGRKERKKVPVYKLVSAKSDLFKKK